RHGHSGKHGRVRASRAPGGRRPARCGPARARPDTGERALGLDPEPHAAAAAAARAGPLLTLEPRKARIGMRGPSPENNGAMMECHGANLMSALHTPTRAC